MSDEVDHSRRRLLTAATVGTGAIGVAFVAVPFLASWLPSARAKALGAPVEVDASKLESGQMMKVVWRGQAVFVVRRSKVVVDAFWAITMPCWPIRSRMTPNSRPTSNRRAPRGRAILKCGWAWRSARIWAVRRSARSNRTTRFKWPARTWAPIGRADSIALATVRSTTSRVECSKACRRRRI